MTKLILCFIVGATVGALLPMRWLPAGPAPNRPETTRMAGLAITLRMLRGGNVEGGIEALEIGLDSDLITVAGLARAGMLVVTNDHSLVIVKRYRDEYRRTVKWTPKFGPLAKLENSGFAGPEQTAKL